MTKEEFDLAWNAAIEAAAKACEEFALDTICNGNPGGKAVRDCAEAVRRLKR
jgi:hypothetical protein